MDYIQFTIAASDFDKVTAEAFWRTLVDTFAADFLPTGSYTLVEGSAVFTLTVTGMVDLEAGIFCAMVATHLKEEEFPLQQLTGIRYTDDDLIEWEVEDAPQVPA